MALYHTVCCLMIAALLQSNIKKITAATVPTQSHSVIEEINDVSTSAQTQFTTKTSDLVDKKHPIGILADVINEFRKTLQTFQGMDGEVRINSSDVNVAVSSNDNNTDQRSNELTSSHLELNKTNSEYKISKHGNNWEYHSSAATVTAHFNRLSPSIAAAVSTAGVCTTLACNESATQILYNIDENVDPCDNFYKFACGGFINKTSIPDDEQKINVFSILENRIEEQLRTVLEEPSSPDELRYIKIIKNFYKSCMNEDAIENLGLEPLQKLLKDLGGWPVVEKEKWNETNFDWLESSYQIVKITSNRPFISLDIVPDQKNSTRNVLEFTEASLGLFRERLIEGINNTKVQAYYKLMVDIAVILGAPRENATAELEESLKFEIELAKIKLPRSEYRNMSRFYNPMTINELSMKHPSIPWKKYINQHLTPHFTVDDSEIVIVTVPEFISKFVDLIKVTPKRVQANYAMWRLTRALANNFNKEITTRFSEYKKIIWGETKSEPRWKRCVNEILIFYGTQSMYIKKYFNRTAKNEIVHIVSDIMEQLKETLRTIDWMDDDTRKNALEKADAISSYIGFPDQLLNDTLMEEKHKSLDFHDNTYFENSLVVHREIYNDTHRKFREPINNTDWEKHANVALVNAFYQPQANYIELPAGILQGLFFNKNRPRYMNYGAIGASVIGHEFTHAFDDEGRQFDKRGNVKNWWTSSTDEKYHQKAKCIIDQYSNYTVEEIGKQVNGFNTQGENIADNGGIKIGYLAYKKWSQEHGEEPTLPGLKYNPRQLFWLSLANVACSKYRPETLENNIIINSHSPYEFQIIGPLSNSPEFAADFNCPLGSKMNPVNKCTFW